MRRSAYVNRYYLSDAGPMPPGSRGGLRGLGPSAAAAQSKCDGAKVKDYGKAVGCLTKLGGKVLVLGAADDSAKAIVCINKFMEKCVKAEAKGDCTPAVRSCAELTTAADTCRGAAATGHLYWSHGGIGRLDLNGRNVTEIIGSGESGGAVGIAVDGQHIYWTNNPPTGLPSIGRANLDGSAPDPAFISGSVAYALGAIAVNNQYLYWVGTNYPGVAAIGRAKLDGSDVDWQFIGLGPRSPAAVALDANFVYWTDQAGPTIGRADLDGSNVNLDFLPVGSWGTAVAGIAVSDQHIYWTDAGSPYIFRANLDGSGAGPLIPLSAVPAYLALDASHVYWSPGMDGQPLGRAALDGSNVNESFGDPFFGSFITVGP
jgi:hypothetical protein